MTKDDADNHMVQKSLTFRAICEAVEIQYCTFKDQKEWLPAKNIRDSKAPPTQYGANLVEETPLTRTEFMALMQSRFAGGGQSKPCFECGSTNHWKKDCPKLKNQQGCGQQKGQTGPPRGSGQTRCSGQTRRNGSQSKNWHFTALGPYDSEMKEVAGKKVYWCGMCKHWNNTHTMEAHVRGAGSTKPSQGPSAQANLGFVDDPSAFWIMDIDDTKDLIYRLSIEVPIWERKIVETH
jgi:hypothetical protein